MSQEIKDTLKHVVIIPDGNRRWARRKGLHPWLGHREGVRAFEKISEKALEELKIPYLTFWGSSWDNLTKRSKTEVNFLFKVFTEQFKRIAKDKRIHRSEVRVNVFGRWREILPKETQEAVEKAIKATENYNKYFLNFLLAYNGIDEMMGCVQKIADSAKGAAVKVTEKLIKENLWAKDLPPVDLLIRTGCEGDPHLSTGFMMWDTAYSQLYFTKTLFPAFTLEEFKKIIKNYYSRERRFGE